MVRMIAVRDVFETNCYFYIDEKTKHGFLIDAGAQGKEIAGLIREHGWVIEKILLTHGHFDHTGGIEELISLIPIPVHAYEGADRYLSNTHLNLSRYCDRDVVIRHVHYFHDRERISLKANPDFYLDVIYVPGHTEDSCMFYNEVDHICFVGDTIFKGSIGNPNYPGGDLRVLQESISKKIFTLPEDTILLSGHSGPTTVGEEKRR